MSMIAATLSALGAFTLGFSYLFFKDYAKHLKQLEPTSWTKLSLVGFVTNFFDTLGIGSAAPSTALFKLMKLVPDRNIPGTLNVGYVIPVVAEAVIFLQAILVEPVTLISMLVSATAGAVLGAGIVSKMPEKKIQLGMGIALSIVACIFLAGLLKLMPVGGEAIGLEGGKLFLGCAGNFILGALMTIGIGLYAPCMALVYALGMSPRVAFPIMMASCAFLMPAASARFIKEGAYDRKASMAVTLSGTVGVLIAAYIVKEMPLATLKWMVTGVIFYASFTMFRSALKRPSADVSKSA